MRQGTRRLTTVTGRTGPPPMIAPAAPGPSATPATRRDPDGPGPTPPRPDEPARPDGSGHPGSAGRARRDQRETGEARARQSPPPGAAALAVALEERTADLQRLKAEYDNYRSRVHRDRLAVREAAVANVLRGFLPVLDAVEEAAGQGELTGGFQRVALALDTELRALGLAAFGAVGDPFDPRVHQAVAYLRSALVDRPVCSEIVRPGYRVGDHLLRPAEVTVTGPAHR
ncbi:nucleotide exchange factor GrpE [Streptomyces sp. NPDC000229]|uniref:nucleotide exchange factor GrpE n=1 Tax=Streptomyces sp. NPDC000229 TaxID=3154247 RepID=UPI00331F427C